jgi:hypothetical protein
LDPLDARHHQPQPHLAMPIPTAITTDRCPPTPNEVPEAADAAVESRSALLIAQKRWSNTSAGTASARYRQIVAEYEHRLADSLGDRVRLREEMLAFGAYLRRREVLPEHIEFCVHEAMKDVPNVHELFETGELGQEIVRWAIEGYHGNGDAIPS